MTIKKKVIKRNSNREGKEWEDLLTEQFNKYRKTGDMYCIKIPTDWVVLRKGAKIVSAFPKAKSEALDYLGILKDGRCISFEAKSTTNKTSFPLSQIKDYQFELHKEIRRYTKEVFYIIRFKELGRYFLVTSDEIDKFIEENERKSIPIGMFGDLVGKEMFDLDILKYL
ncbi:MAG: Holliday junction resolvase RecU [Paraclostridium sp.]